MSNAKFIKPVPASKVLEYYGIRDIRHLSSMNIASYIRKFYKELADKLEVKTSDLILI